MTAILNVQEAFNALQSGKTVLCRYAGDGTLPGDKDFSPLDHMPATVFVMPHYEFCIKVEMMELAGISFTKPLVPEDIKYQQEIYIVMPTCILRTKYDLEHADISHAVTNGFAQADPDNAQLQLKAFAALFGNTIDSVEVKDGFVEEKPKRQRKQRETKITNVDEVAEIETDPALIVDKFTAQITNCTATDAVLALRPVFFANGHLECEHTQHLCKLTEEKLLELDPEQYTPKVESSEDNDHQNLINDLINQVSKAQSPAEVNSVYQHAKGWTEQQIAPLHAAVGRRLSELQQPASKEPPSLLVRIQNAADQTELDALESEVLTRDPQIVPSLMSEVRKHRAQLKNSDDELTP